jgi:hypothetical protein
MNCQKIRNGFPNPPPPAGTTSKSRSNSQPREAKPFTRNCQKIRNGLPNNRSGQIRHVAAPGSPSCLRCRSRTKAAHRHSLSNGGSFTEGGCLFFLSTLNKRQSGSDNSQLSCHAALGDWALEASRAVSLDIKSAHFGSRCISVADSTIQAGSCNQAFA